MIGNLVRFSRPQKRRTLAYTPRWQHHSQRVRAPIKNAVNNDRMLFDRPAALPVATMRSRSKIAVVASWYSGLRRVGWRWLRPRLVPLAVALTGMFAVLGSAEYLTRLARRTPAKAQLTQLAVSSEPAPAVTIIDGDPLAMGGLTISNGPPGATVILDGNPLPVGRVIQLPVGAPMPVRLIPTR